MTKTDLPRFVIDGFEELTQQDIFDLAVAHIGSTRKPSNVDKCGDPGQGCFYGGSGCNAAPLIKPELRQMVDDLGNGELPIYLDSGGVNTAWTSLTRHNLVPDTNHYFIGQLQDAHDIAARREYTDFLPDWKRNMEDLANRNRLDTSKLDALNITA